MKNNNLENILDYKSLYYDLKDKYDKVSMELEELKIDNKLKEEEINLLRQKLNSNLNCINSFENKGSSSMKGEDNLNNDNNNSIFKQNNKKYDTYSVDSFRNDLEQGNDLLQELMKNDIEEINSQRNNNDKKLMKIEHNYFQILKNKLIIDKNNNKNSEKNHINKTLTGDIDAILLNIKMKQESLHQTQKMFNLHKEK